MLKYKKIPIFYDCVKAQWPLAVKAIVFSVFVALFEVISNSLVFPLIQVLNNNNQVSFTRIPAILRALFLIYAKFPKQEQLLIIALSLFCLTIIKNTSLFFAQVNMNDFKLRAGNLLRQKCIERLLHLDINFYTRRSQGEVLSYVNEQTQRSEPIFYYCLDIIKEILVIGFLLSFLIILSPKLTIFTVFSLTIVALSLRRVIKQVQIHGGKVVNGIEAFSALITETISGMRVVKSFNAESRELQQAKQSLNNRYKEELKSYKILSAIGPLSETAGILILVSILLVGAGTLATSGNINLSILLTYMLALLRIQPRVSVLNHLRSEISLQWGSLEAIQGFLSSTVDLSIRDGKYAFQGLKSAIVFEHLTFTFPTNSEPTLYNISFSVPKGTTTAIVGPSGSGKSTLVDLIMRFYDPDSGSIKIDGIDLQDLQIGSWRRSIAMVSQDTFLFNSSIRENIAYGRPDATDSEIVEAAKKAYAYDFIQDLPQGFETRVGNRGTRLSGGQRQRIAIARAILCDPDILILDEATSALDSKSERIVQKAIEEVSRNRTVIVIAHRLSTIERSDKILVLKDGKLFEQGTHQELLDQKGIYYSLYESQKFSDNSAFHSETNS